MDDERKHLFLETLWNILENFVDRAWGVDSVQLAAPEGNGHRGDRKLGPDGHPVVDSPYTVKSKKSRKAACPAAGKTKR